MVHNGSFDKIGNTSRRSNKSLNSLSGHISRNIAPTELQLGPNDSKFPLVFKNALRIDENCSGWKVMLT